MSVREGEVHSVKRKGGEGTNRTPDGSVYVRETRNDRSLDFVGLGSRKGIRREFSERGLEGSTTPRSPPTVKIHNGKKLHYVINNCSFFFCNLFITRQ